MLFDIAAFAQTPASPPPAVSVVAVSMEDVAQSVEFIGRVEAIQQVDVRARVQGFLEKVAFTEGQDVKADDLLFTIERDQYEAALLQANSQQASAEANLRNAQVTLERRQQLYDRESGTRADLDLAIANRDTAAASVESAKAAVRTAELNLGYTRIVSPIAGRIGKPSLTRGNVVGPDSGTLARVVQLDPIRVLFSISERDFISVVQQDRGAALEQINASFVPTLRLPSGTVYADQGRIDFVGNEIDQATGTLPVRAAFANPAGLLLPGGTVSVRVRPAEAKRMPLVPVQAVQENRQGKFVLVVGADNRVEQRPVKATQQVGQNWAVDDGLKAGESVIVEGLQKVRPGAQVQTVPAASANVQ
ncbi:efflux RND transporter periplasmic adaptor subunit [Bradyrhizobium sp. CSA112]|uniref:efflux RND transporter periplasmic adaptor subunit n=1 Tax=Bradyrhizobium sp. CSA112 TaxID=2699170 RepID=UPI0023B0B296|nr:efflux RND transporter periplasmic adaptor subunit [Bradyrhizobium sp. CSA112]